MNKNVLVAFLFVGILFVSCSKDSLDSDNVNSSGGVTLSVSLRGVTETCAEFYGTAELSDNVTADSFGILYSQDRLLTAASATKKVIVNIYGTDYSVPVTRLIPGETYYYASYIKIGEVYKYGQVHSFTTITPIVPELGPALEITQESASVRGFARPPVGPVDNLLYGLQYSSSTDFSSDVESIEVSEGEFEVRLESLTLYTTYYYRSVIVLNGCRCYGPVYSFNTLGVTPVEPSDCVNLSVSASANCYIVSVGGKYCFLAAKGNRKEDILHRSQKAEVLWESFGTSTEPARGSVISSVSYADGYIMFSTNDFYREGNALIAVIDEEGEILWSWHIWLTDQPRGQIYYNGAGTMMDRNLGATSATPGDIGAQGLLYQWGRKDPFFGKSIASTGYMAVVQSNSYYGTVEFAVANPMTFIGCGSSIDFDDNGDWYYTGNYSTDLTRWTTSDKPKSVYDPCPVGWRVPDGGDDGVWSVAAGGDNSFECNSDSVNNGVDFSGILGDDQSIWYPYSGYISQSGYTSSASTGSYWSASISPYYYGSGRIDAAKLWIYTSAYPSTGEVRVEASSVRCIQE